MIIPEAWLQVFADIHWRTVTNPDKNDLVLLKCGIYFETHFANQGAVSLRQNLGQLAIAPVVRKAMKPAGQCVRRITLGTRREGHPAVYAAVFDTVHFAVDTLEKKALTEENFRTGLAFLQLVRKEHRVPVVAQ